MGKFNLVGGGDKYPLPSFPMSDKKISVPKDFLDSDKFREGSLYDICDLYFIGYQEVHTRCVLTSIAALGSFPFQFASRVLICYLL
jgi:hypothetical protein